MASTSANRPKLGPSPFSIPADLPKLPEVEGTDPTRCVLDSFRIAIAKVVADALEPLTIEQVYEGVDYGKKGEDFTVALPRFRLPGKVDQLAKQVLDKVCICITVPFILSLSLPYVMYDIRPYYPNIGLGLSLHFSANSLECSFADDV